MAVLAVTASSSYISGIVRIKLQRRVRDNNVDSMQSELAFSLMGTQKNTFSTKLCSQDVPNLSFTIFSTSCDI